MGKTFICVAFVIVCINYVLYRDYYFVAPSIGESSHRLAAPASDFPSSGKVVFYQSSANWRTWLYAYGACEPEEFFAWVHGNSYGGSSDGSIKSPKLMLDYFLSPECPVKVPTVFAVPGDEVWVINISNNGIVCQFEVNITTKSFVLRANAGD